MSNVTVDVTLLHLAIPYLKIELLKVIPNADEGHDKWLVRAAVRG